MSIQIRRAYEPLDPTDGRRYLVDRIWPRGVTADRLGIERWRKDLAPSEALCRWYGHDVSRYPEFRRRYRAELLHDPARWASLRAEAAEGPVTLVFGARDVPHSNAAVLAEFIAERLDRPSKAADHRPPAPSPASSRADPARSRAPDAPGTPTRSPGRRPPPRTPRTRRRARAPRNRRP